MITFQNKNKYIAIHIKNCNQLKKHGGKPLLQSKCKYVEHLTFQKANQYAQSIGIPIINCSFCTPQLNINTGNQTPNTGTTGLCVGRGGSTTP